LGELFERVVNFRVQRRVVAVAALPVNVVRLQLCA